MSGITNPAEEYFKDGIWGWDGTVWRKLPLVWGYSAQYAEYEYTRGVAAGHRFLTFSTVPAGQIWIITNFSARCSTANPSLIALTANLGGVELDLHAEPYATALATVDVQCYIIMAEDDFLKAYFDDCALNDDIYAYAAGYKMKVAE